MDDQCYYVYLNSKWRSGFEADFLDVQRMKVCSNQAKHVLRNASCPLSPVGFDIKCTDKFCRQILSQNFVISLWFREILTVFQNYWWFNDKKWFSAMCGERLYLVPCSCMKIFAHISLLDPRLMAHRTHLISWVYHVVALLVRYDPISCFPFKEHMSWSPTNSNSRNSRDFNDYWDPMKFAGVGT